MRLARFYPTVPARRTFARNWFDYPTRSTEDTEACAEWCPRADIVERDDHHEISIELPGLDRDDVKVSVENSQLTISGETKTEDTKEGEGYRRIERRYGTFSRSFTLPKGVDAEKIGASFKNGILHLDVPKPVEVMPKQVEIN